MIAHNDFDGFFNKENILKFIKYIETIDKNYTNIKKKRNALQENIKNAQEKLDAFVISFNLLENGVKLQTPTNDINLLLNNEYINQIEKQYSEAKRDFIKVENFVTPLFKKTKLHEKFLCKICDQNYIDIVLDCEHTLCNDCCQKIKKTAQNKDDDNSSLFENSNNSDEDDLTVSCPYCRTYCRKLKKMRFQ